MANSYKASSPRGPKPDMVMEPSYNYPQDDYALNILTQAAMHSTSNSNNNSEISHSRSGYDHNPTSTADFHGAGAELREITNQSHPGHRDIQSSGSSLTPELPNNYNHLVLPHSSSAPRMETLAFNPAQAARHNSFMDTAFRGIGSEISRNYANNLGILNAESYSDHVSPGRFDARTQAAETTLAFGMIPHHQVESSSREDGDEIETGARRRKKPRIEARSDDDDEKKKSRGRPRVDTKDETAADVSEKSIHCICFDAWTGPLFIHLCSLLPASSDTDTHGSKSLPSSQRDYNLFLGETSPGA